MKDCTSGAEKSCSKEWYKVVSWGDYYYNLDCSTTEPKAEMEEKRVNIVYCSVHGAVGSKQIGLRIWA